MTELYHLLHFNGKIDPLDYPEGSVVGSDEFGAEFEVIDIDYDPVKKVSTVHLQYATVESKRRHYETEGRAVPQSDEHARFLRHFSV
jgi:hypothetical protein